MKLEDLMSRPPLTAQPTDDVALALQIMAWGGVRHLPVVVDGNVVGVANDEDLLRNLGRNPKVAEVMVAPAPVARPGDDVSEAVRILTETHAGCVPVVEGESLIGVVTLTDVLRGR